MALTDESGWGDFFPLGRGAEVLRAAWPPVLQGVLRGRPEHFRVNEVLAPEPAPESPGQAEHLWVRVEKRAANTAWVAHQLAAALGVRKRDIGFSGHKDRHAVTLQWFSVWLPGYCAASAGHLPDLTDFARAADVRVHSALWQARKIRRGTHRYNDFEITLSAVRGTPAAITDRLQRIAQEGVPNLFGPQRFGRQAVATLAWDSPRWARDREERGWQISAVRSALFNHLLAQRVDQGGWQQPLAAADWLQWQGSRAGFALTRLDERLQALLDSGELSPSAWLAGCGDRPGETPLTQESLQLTAWQAWIDALAERGVRGQRRATRLQPLNLSWGLHDDELVLAFRLPAGAFATAVIAAVGTWAEPAHPGQET